MIKRKPTNAICANTDDPAKAGRIQCRFTELDGQVLPEWIEPVDMSGWFWIPEKNDVVEVLIPCDNSDFVEFAHTMSYKGKLRLEKETYPSEFKQNYGKRKGFKTSTGMMLLVDETKGQEQFTITHSNNMVISITKDNILFGSSAASEPMVLGSLWKSLMVSILQTLNTLCTDLSTAQVITGTGPAPFQPADIAKFAAHASTLNSLKGSVDSGDQLSDFIKGQKLKP